jgi:septal ring factor EnvC (AmiA/AmiB activator)
MHTDLTLDILSRVTTSLGNSLRTFEEKTCAAFETRELERERAARQQRQKSATNEASESRRPTARKPKKLNLRTYKLHALGDYVDSIRCFGTTDSYSTQSVSI